MLQNKSSKTKVYIDSEPLLSDKMSGIGHVALETLKALSLDENFRNKYELILLVPFDKTAHLEKHNLKITIKKLPIPMILLNILSKRGLLPAPDRLYGKGVWIFFNFKNWPLKYSKSITYVHDVGYIRFPQFVQNKNRIYLEKNMPTWLNRTDAVITVSNHAAKELKEFFQSIHHKVYVIHNAHSSYFHLQDKKTVDSKIREYNLPKRYVLYVGNIEPRKNLEALVNAYRCLPVNLRKSYPLVMIGGDGWNNEKVLEAISEANDSGCRIVRPEKYVSDEDLAILYAGAVILVHPAIYEGFGITPLEAMAAGTPVITSSTSSLPEVGGDAVIYVNPYSVSDISDKINELLKDEQMQQILIQRGIVQSKKFSWEKASSNLVKVIDRLNS